jgi:hypothetical protein
MFGTVSPDGEAYLDSLVTIIRIPIAIFVGLAFSILHIVYFVLETILVSLWLPIAVIAQSRNELKKSWVSTYPNVIRRGLGIVRDNNPLGFNNLGEQGLGCGGTLLILTLGLLIPQQGLSDGLTSVYTWALND